MKKTIDELLQLTDEALYDYVLAMEEYKHTKAELLELIEQKNLLVTVKRTANNIDTIHLIIEGVRHRILFKLLNEEHKREMQGWEIAYMLLNRDAESRFHFVERNRKYLTAAELIPLLKYGCRVEAPSYDEMLVDLYLETKEFTMRQKRE